MLALTLRRMVELVPVVGGMSLFIFFVAHSIPADPARLAAGPEATPEMVAKVRAELGLDKPLYVQYLHFLYRLLQGDLGRSILTGRSVRQDLLRYLPATLELTTVSLLFALGLGIPLGIAGARHEGRALDHASRLGSLYGISLPVFWIGIIFQLIFYAKLGWLPSGGRLSPGISPPGTWTGSYVLDAIIARQPIVALDALKHLLLPGLTQSFIALALTARMTRSTMLEILRQDYIRTARAKGLSERAVLYIHGFRNAAIPVVTVAGLQLGVMLSGAVMTETVFSWPGVGLFAYKAIVTADFPALIGFTLMVSVVYALINLGVDLFCLVIDPRIRR